MFGGGAEGESTGWNVRQPWGGSGKQICSAIEGESVNVQCILVCVCNQGPEKKGNGSFPFSFPWISLSLGATRMCLKLSHPTFPELSPTHVANCYTLRIFQNVIPLCPSFTD